MKRNGLPNRARSLQAHVQWRLVVADETGLPFDEAVEGAAYLLPVAVEVTGGHGTMRPIPMQRFYSNLV